MSRETCLNLNLEIAPAQQGGEYFNDHVTTVDVSQSTIRKNIKKYKKFKVFIDEAFGPFQHIFGCV
jgi:hypothetical protein